MAASAWKVFPAAKQKIGNSTIDLSGAFRLSLHRTSASINTRAAALTIFTSVSWLSSGGGWGKSGAPGADKANGQGLTLTGVSWVSDGASGYKFDCTDPVFTASASTLSAVRWAVIRQSAGSVNSGHILCYAPLSTAQFDVQASNTLTIQMNASGIFTLT